MKTNTTVSIGREIEFYNFVELLSDAVTNSSKVKLSEDVIKEMREKACVTHLNASVDSYIWRASTALKPVVIMYIDNKSNELIQINYKGVKKPLPNNEFVTNIRRAAGEY